MDPGSYSQDNDTVVLRLEQEIALMQAVGVDGRRLCLHHALSFELQDRRLTVIAAEVAELADAGVIRVTDLTISIAAAALDARVINGRFVGVI